jgi:RimJ/RimL family protein N-acetyltransferase
MTSHQPHTPATTNERLVTDRLELRPVLADDADALTAVFEDARMYRFTGGHPDTLEQRRARYAEIEAGRANDPDQTAQRNWTVRRRADGHTVGMVQAVFADGGRSAEIAWAVGVSWQGQGIASEAAKAVVAWLETRGVQTITAHINPDHHASITVARRAGLHPTGESRERWGIREQRWRRTATQPSDPTAEVADG